MEQLTENNGKENRSKEYSARWQARFDFFDRYGAPSSPGFRQALKQLPFRQKFRVNMNLIAFIFGPIYLFVLACGKRTSC